MNAPVLERPTPALVVKYIEILDQGNAALADQALTRLVAAFPDHHDAAAVLLKATTVNSLYATNIYAIFQVAQHSCALNIDPKLAQGSLDVVDEIARITLKGKQKRNYSLAIWPGRICGLKHSRPPTEAAHEHPTHPQL